MKAQSKILITIATLLSSQIGFADDTLQSISTSADPKQKMIRDNAIFSYYTTSPIGAAIDPTDFYRFRDTVQETVVNKCAAQQAVELAHFMTSREYKEFANAYMARRVRNGGDPREMAAIQFKIAVLDNSSKNQTDGWFNESDNTERLMGRTARRGNPGTDRYHLYTRAAPALAIYEMQNDQALFTVAAAIDSGNKCRIASGGGILRFLTGDAVDQLYGDQK